MKRMFTNHLGIPNEANPATATSTNARIVGRSTHAHPRRSTRKAKRAIITHMRPWLLIFSAATLFAADYEVGPGMPLQSIGAVPWATLQPGDRVWIYWRPEPYREKWVICRQGTAAAPIYVSGVPGPEGQLPIIDGENATTAPGLDFWNDNRAVIKIGGATVPADTMPRHIVIEDLDVRNAYRAFSFTDEVNRRLTYNSNAAAIYVEKGEDIIIRRCRISGSGNGLFVASGDAALSRRILIEANDIRGNGNPGSTFEHNTYTAAVGIEYRYNRFGPLRPGANGSNLKDRSAGLVVRQNWIEGGNRQLDLVEGDDTEGVWNDPSYRETRVIGNVLIENVNDGNRQMVHYGGDNQNPALYRKGTLIFWFNTLVSRRTDRTTWFRLSTNDERADARYNVFYPVAAGNTASWLDTAGILELRLNWTKPAHRASFGEFTGMVANVDLIEGETPGFLDESTEDFRPATGAAILRATPDPAPEEQYWRHRWFIPRLPGPGLGAFAWAE